MFNMPRHLSNDVQTLVTINGTHLKRQQPSKAAGRRIWTLARVLAEQKIKGTTKARHANLTVTETLFPLSRALFVMTPMNESNTNAVPAELSQYTKRRPLLVA